MKYVIGVDFGTLSARALLVNAENGKEIATCESPYLHGVMDKTLPCGKALPKKCALQMPSDYINSLSSATKEVIKKANIDPCDVIGIGIDFTASTVFPIDETGTPLCESEKYNNEPHAYVKLWKHGTATEEADDITELAKSRGEYWIGKYGGKISAELMLPKILETARKCPELYRDTHTFIEAGDWINLVLTGEDRRSPAFAGYKIMWDAENGYPKNDFFKALDPILDNIAGTKLPNNVCKSITESGGKLNKRGSEITGLCEGTQVALAMIDAHASMAGLGVVGSGDIVLIIGTSTCHILNSSEKRDVKGISGYVKDGIFPGIYTYEAGQSGVGDMFAWFVKNSVPAAYQSEADEKGVNIHTLLTEKARELKIGESGITVLDWFSGNRSILSNSALTGLIFGLNLQTKPEEIYRAMLESTAFGTRVILEQYEKYGITISNVTATGGIANKNNLMMQIYADVLGKDIKIASTALSGALGSAIYAAAAAGAHSSINDAVAAMSVTSQKTVSPIEENVKKYDALYKKYRELHDYFGEIKFKDR
ncbi:MAG: ribulokinase [Clostridia bacterium]|nr:ribulokinase [Clostridia bacterium]